jgi:hypothetical protein
MTRPFTIAISYNPFSGGNGSDEEQAERPVRSANRSAARMPSVEVRGAFMGISFSGLTMRGPWCMLRPFLPHAEIQVYYTSDRKNTLSWVVING